MIKNNKHLRSINTSFVHPAIQIKNQNTVLSLNINLISQSYTNSYINDIDMIQNCVLPLNKNREKTMHKQLFTLKNQSQNNKKQDNMRQSLESLVKSGHITQTKASEYLQSVSIHQAILLENKADRFKNLFCIFLGFIVGMGCYHLDAYDKPPAHMQ